MYIIFISETPHDIFLNIFDKYIWKYLDLVIESHFHVIQYF